MRPLRSAVALGLLIASAGSAAEILRLDEALSRARRDNPTIQGAQADVAAARGRLAQAGVLAPNPVLSGSGTHHRIGSGVDIDHAVSLAQELQVGGQRGLRIAAARHDVDHAEQLLFDRERLIGGEVRRAFAGLVAAGRRRAIAVEAAVQADRLADIAASRVAAGDLGRIDLDLARIETLKTHADAASASTEIARATARLAAAIGADPDERMIAEASDVPTRPTPSDTSAIARALEARPDLAAARADRARLEGEADLTHRAGIIPNPTVRGFYSHESGDETLVGGEIQVPLPVFDRQQGTETDLRGQAAAAGATVRGLERDIPNEVRVALARHHAAAATWLRYREEGVSATEGMRARLERALQAGLMALPDVIVQGDRVRDSRRAEVDAWLDLREAEADVIEAIGENPW